MSAAVSAMPIVASVGTAAICRTRGQAAGKVGASGSELGHAGDAADGGDAEPSAGSNGSTSSRL